VRAKASKAPGLRHGTRARAALRRRLRRAVERPVRAAGRYGRDARDAAARARRRRQGGPAGRPRRAQLALCAAVRRRARLRPRRGRGPRRRRGSAAHVREPGAFQLQQVQPAAANLSAAHARRAGHVRQRAAAGARRLVLQWSCPRSKADCAVDVACCGSKRGCYAVLWPATLLARAPACRPCAGSMRVCVHRLMRHCHTPFGRCSTASF